MIAVLAVLPFLAEAQNGPAIARIVCGPYLQSVTTDSFTVMWMTDVDAVGWVEIAPDNEENFYYKDRPKYYDMRGHGLKPIGKIHKVTIGELKPGTSYRYRMMMTADTAMSRPLLSPNRLEMKSGMVEALILAEYRRRRLATMSQLR